MAITGKGVKVTKSVFDKTSDALKEIAKKLGPILGSLFSLMGTVLSLLAKGASHLAEHIWLLFFPFSFFPSLSFLRVAKKEKVCP